MKNIKVIFRKIHVAALMFFVSTLAFTFSVNGQFTVNGFIGLRYGRTTATPAANNIQAIGIGNFDFSLGRVPAAMLHINSNFVSNPFYGAGEVFRTDCPVGQSTSWRLLRGGTEYGRLFNLNSDNHFHLQSFSGDMFLRTGSIGGNGRTHLRIFNTNGFIGIGPGLDDAFTARSELHIHDTTTTYLQFTNTSTQPSPNNPLLTDGFIVGINSNIAELRQQENQDIRIYTGTSGAERARIVGTPTPNQGFAGIGQTNPNHHLSVSGSVEVQIPDSGYIINDQYVLWHNGVTSNLFAGVGAGNNNTGILSSTFVGADAGKNVLSNPDGGNTFIGFSAGKEDLSGHSNTFVGSGAGLDNDNGSFNTFVGLCGGRNTTGNENAFFGINAGNTNITGNQNTFVGGGAGNTNTTGDLNTFLGYLSLGSGTNASSLTNATAIGAYASASNNNTVVLGAVSGENGYNGPAVNVGIGTTDPKNQLEVTGPTGPTGLSGLRLTNLAGVTGPTGNGNVLSVNANGDVIVVADATGGGGGGTGTVTGGQNGLTPVNSNTILELGGTLNHLTDINLGGNNLTFTGGGKVGIGANNPVEKLQVAGNSVLHPLAITNSDSWNVILPVSSIGNQGVLFMDNNSLNAGDLTTHRMRITAANGGGVINGFGPSGVSQQRFSFNAGSNQNRFDFKADNATDFFRMQSNGMITAFADNPSPGFDLLNARIDDPSTTISATFSALSAINNNTTNNNYAILGFSDLPSVSRYAAVGVRFKTHTTPKIGDFFIATNNGTVEVEALTINEFQNVGIGSNSPSCKLDVNGTICSFGTPLTSDVNLKTKINPIESPVEKILSLNGIKFEWNSFAFPDSSLPDSLAMIGIQYGFIAQDVETVLPELVKHSGDFKAIDYNKVVPILVEAMKQQQVTIDSLQTALSSQQQSSLDSLQSAQITAIQNCISNLPPGMCGSARIADPENDKQKSTVKEVVLKGEIILDQNNPNPFKESTTITYFVPQYIHFAQIVFSDNTGRIINTVDIDYTGQGQLNVKAENLGSGIFSYSIVVDGKTVDTKKMIKTK